MVDSIASAAIGSTCTTPIYPTMTRLLYPILVASLLAILPAGAAKRNIILFVTDDQSPDTGAYGNPASRPPTWMPSPLTAHASPTPSPPPPPARASRSVILTGLHNHANGQYGTPHDYHKFESFESLQPLPVLLQMAAPRIPHRPDREVPCRT